jgi:hypothetical protein
MSSGKINVGMMNSSNYEHFDFFVFGILVPLSHKKDKEEFLKLIKKFTNNYKNSYGKKAFKDKLGGKFLKAIWEERDTGTLVIKSNLFIENFVNEIIQKKFRYHELIKDFSLNDKLKIMQSKNYLGENLYSDLILLNRLRNKFAHNLFFKMADFDVSGFYYCAEANDIKCVDLKVKEAVNTFILRNVLMMILSRLTQKHVAIVDVKVPKNMA